ncbi:sodium-coupled neutral amino acid transporter 3a [Danio rerio]|uniref:Sodium-coupled neutral amino acid transporter 3a n=1 Tax=Danio rerio TaxID=7955 RepID=A5PLD2_DANRE|nr:sodium-coupled neutral amino acid transporter 3a [Danio rerio]AAI42854.1 Zgc:165543 protein [Danio rerio]|eukprot:NP_001092235.1 sodium-coupled neutral amino acid transporter 3 [Danio rerio]
MEPAELNTIPNGKGHEAGEETTATAIKSQSEDAAHTDRTAGNVEANLVESSEFLSNADDKKTPRFTDFEGKTSFGMSVFNLGNAIMGSGILGLAYAMANTGIVLFVILLTVVAGLSAYSIHLLLKSSGVVGIRAYEQLGYRAFGTPGKMAAGIAITLQNIGAMSSYLYIVKYEFPLVIQAFLKVDNPSG